MSYDKRKITSDPKDDAVLRFPLRHQETERREETTHIKGAELDEGARFDDGQITLCREDREQVMDAIAAPPPSN